MNYRKGTRGTPLVVKIKVVMSKVCNAPGLLQESLGPFGPEVSRECLSGCLRGPSGPGLRSVQKVSRECPRSVKKVSRTLRGHSRVTFWTLRRPGPEGPQRHPEGHSRDTLGPKGPRDSCSRPGALQSKVVFSGWIPIRPPTPTSDDFPSDSGWEKWILTKETCFPLVWKCFTASMSKQRGLQNFRCSWNGWVY